MNTRMLQRAALAALGFGALAGCASTPPGPTPVQVLQGRVDKIDTRLGSVERVVNNGSLVRLSERIDALNGQLRDLRGRIEELQNTNAALRKQQLDLYNDLNRRVTALEKAEQAAGGAAPGSPGGAGADSGSGAASGPAAGGAPGQEAQSGPQAASAGAGVGAGAGGTGGAGADQAAYKHAFNTLASGDYAAAVREFKKFQRDYPHSSLGDNAQYWLGESYYVQRDFGSAAAAFRDVGRLYPRSRKAPDALLKLGYSEYEQKHMDAARATLNEVVRRYPRSHDAQLAAQRLHSMAGGH